MKIALFKTMMCAGLTGILLTGCANDNVYNPNAATKKYQENWEKQFGEIDPQQTWNTSTSRIAEITIGYSGNYTLKIYTTPPKNEQVQAYLLGRYDVVGDNSHSLQFDTPSSLTTVYVALIDQDGGQIIKSAPIVDGKVNVAFGTDSPSTRTIHTSGGTIRVTEGYGIQYGKEDCQIPLQILPEGINNKKKVTENFLYKSIGKLFYIRPIYFKSNDWVTLGIYYYDENKKIIEKPVWTRDHSTNGCWWGNEELTWNNLDHTAADTDQLLAQGASTLWCQSIKIETPYGMSFGFYIQNGNDKFYSEKRLNETYRGEKQCHAATFDYQGKRYITFEDQTNRNGSSDMDLNDLVCVIGEDMDNSGSPDIVEKDDTEDTDMKYIIACEDLGGSDDFDFNDIVLAINHVSGTKTVSVELLAAGGTLPAKVMYNNTTLFEEVHAAFGVSSNDMVNTGGNITLAPIKSAAIEIPDNFTIATHASKFKITVSKAGNSNIEISVPDKNGVTPQAFVVAAPDWEWPKERQNITERYPKFTEWVSNQSKDDWYNALWDESYE